MIRLNVFIQVEKQNYDQVVSIAKDLVAASQKDNGCVAYDLFQSTTRQDVLMISFFCCSSSASIRAL
jgi:quinol monooxygenase YgiN